MSAENGVNQKPNDVAKLQSSVPVQFDFFNQDHFQTMQRVCTMFATSELVPDMYKISNNNPKEKAIANCMIALEISHRIGASPLMVMQNLYIVYGRPGWSSKFLVATINTCGKFHPLQYKMEINGKTKFGEVELENWSCVAFTSPKNSNAVLESVPVDLKMAIAEGWYGRKGSKWATIPKQMLRYRAATFWTNAFAPEISMGMKTAEEIEDIEDIQFEDIPKKVEADINDNANKTVVEFPPADATPPANTAAPAQENKPETTAAAAPAETNDQTNGTLFHNQNEGPGY